MKALIVGAGIGALYYEQLQKIGFDKDNIFVSDLNLDRIKENCPGVNENNISETIPTDDFDIAFVCTPNHIHEKVARFVRSKIIAVEKPGFESPEHWAQAILDMGQQGTKLVMIDNNSYRPQIEALSKLVLQNDITKIHCLWSAANSIPGAGGWFTTKEKSFGGVGHDLLPHMINFAQSLTSGYDYKTLEHVKTIKEQYVPNLDWIANNNTNVWGHTDFNGIYDVDDYARAEFIFDDNIPVICEAQWSRTAQTMAQTNAIVSTENILKVDIYFKDDSYVTYKFDLCPNDVYGVMIQDYLNMSDHTYQKKIKKDIFVHKAIQ